MKIGIVAPPTDPATNPSILGSLASLGSIVRYEAPPVEDEAGLAALVEQLVASDCHRLVYDGTEHVAELMLAYDPAPSFLVPGSGAMAQPDDFWRKLVRYGMLCFERRLQERLQRLSCITSYFQFFPDPGEQRLAGDLYGASFVEDRDDDLVTLPLVTELALELGIRRLRVQSRARAPSGYSVGDMQVTILPYGTATDRLALFSFCTESPTSRASLGEAMAAGQVIIGHKLSVAADYCANSVSGLIYPSYSTRPAFPGFDRSSLQTMSRSARRRAVNGWSDWKLDAERLRSIVAQDGRRWSTVDCSARFNREIRKAAHERAWHG